MGKEIQHKFMVGDLKTEDISSLFNPCLQNVQQSIEKAFKLTFLMKTVIF